MTTEATYHGIVKIRCNTCGYESTEKEEMEFWNDYGVACFRPNHDPSTPRCAGTTTFWMADGSVNTFTADGDPVDA